MHEKINVGVIGCGYWGPNLIRNFNQIFQSEMIQCSDLSEERLRHMRELCPRIETTTDAQNMIENPKIDAIAIATPVSTHYELAKRALLADKHVLVEKPITATSQEAKKLIKLAKEKKRVLMVDHTFEYNKAVIKMGEIVRKKELGKIYTINMIRVNLGLFQKDINVIWDLVPHDISILIYTLGMTPTSLRAIGDAYIQPGIEDDAYVNLRFPNKIMANIHVSWLDPCKIRRTTIVGSKKMLVYDDVEPTEKIKIYDKGVTITKNGLPIQKYYDTFGEFQLLYRAGNIYSPRVESTEPLNTMCRHFLDCIKNDKTPKSDGESGLKVIKVIEATKRSLEANGSEVRIT